MNAEREIIKHLREARSIDETDINVDGDEYSSHYGQYTKNGRPISKEEYHNARLKIMNTKDDPDSFDAMLNEPHKATAEKVQGLIDYASSLEYDEEYEVARPTRDHFPRIQRDDKKTRVESIMSDTGFDPATAVRLNAILLDFTSTNPTDELKPEDREILDAYLDTAPVYLSKPVYRGMGFKSYTRNGVDAFKYFSSLEVGTVTQMRDYTCFSSNLDIAINFADANGDLQVFMVNTKNLTGVSIDHLSSLDYLEEELLYKKEVKFRVLDNTVKGKTVYMQLEEVALNEVDIDEQEISTLPISGNMGYKKMDQKEV